MWKGMPAGRRRSHIAAASSPSWRFPYLNQREFLCAGPGFDFVFAAEGVTARALAFGVDEDDRAAGFGVAGALFGVVMLMEALLEVVGDADVEGVVGAAEEVDEIHGEGWRAKGEGRR